MENKFMKFVTENKWFVIFYLMWTFIHLVLFISGNKYSGDFWPFEDGDIKEYNFLELFVYLSLPLLILVIVKLGGKDIRKALDDE